MPVIDPNGALCQVGTEYTVSGYVNNDANDEHQFSFNVSLLNATGSDTRFMSLNTDSGQVSIPFDAVMKAMADAFYTYMVDSLPAGYAFEGGSPNVSKEIIGDVNPVPPWSYTHP
jgi:hypothetical protein